MMALPSASGISAFWMMPNQRWEYSRAELSDCGVGVSQGSPPGGYQSVTSLYQGLRVPTLARLFQWPDFGACSMAWRRASALARIMEQCSGVRAGTCSIDDLILARFSVAVYQNPQSSDIRRAM